MKKSSVKSPLWLTKDALWLRDVLARKERGGRTGRQGKKVVLERMEPQGPKGKRVKLDLVVFLGGKELRGNPATKERRVKGENAELQESKATGVLKVHLVEEDLEGSRGYPDHRVKLDQRALREIRESVDYPDHLDFRGK